MASGPVVPLRGVVTSLELAVQTDDTSTTGVLYVGKAAIGSAASLAAWQIFKLDESTSPSLIITWADGDAEFNNVWANRTTLNYS